MRFRSIIALLVVISASLAQAQSALSGERSGVTAFTDLQSHFVLKPGETYLSFMEKTVKPALDAFDDVIRKDPAYKAHRWSQLQQNLIDRGAGVAIRIDSDNYIFNIGYNDGSDATDDVKSGRSYGVGPTGRESDPSDIAYLRELENYLKNEPDSVEDFVAALMKVLTNCDTSGWKKLSVDGQIVATDFLAIYTAESDRHIMVKLSARSHPWEIDLAAATFVSIFDSTTGLLMKDGRLVRGSLPDWWAQGSTGSGIGNTRRDRIALQRLITRETASAKEVEQIAEMVGPEAKTDVIQALLVYLNSSDSPMTMSSSDSRRLSDLVSGYLVHVQQHSDEIAKAIE